MSSEAAVEAMVLRGSEEKIANLGQTSESKSAESTQEIKRNFQAASQEDPKNIIIGDKIGNFQTMHPEFYKKWLKAFAEHICYSQKHFSDRCIQRQKEERQNNEHR